MDTRFWGPSGWKLLHLIAAEPAKDPAAVLEWFGLLEYVLPCKYCRASFHDYMKAQPLTIAIVKDPATFSRWMYDIHNRVNDKLRKQGLLKTPNPTWASVHKHYSALHATLCKEQPFMGWDFMTSVAFSTPSATTKSTPMPLPSSSSIPDDDATKNRYNMLDYRARLGYLKRWWELIPSILPCAAWRDAWAAAVSDSVSESGNGYDRSQVGTPQVGMLPVGTPPMDDGREAVMRWMWAVEGRVCGGLRCPTPHPSLRALKLQVAAYESACSKKRKGRTCRRTRSHNKKAQASKKSRRNRRQGIASA